jgi:hypothetical protein
MKLAIARGLFLVGALGVATMAAATWQEPGTKILSAKIGEGQCLKPISPRAEVQVSPDHDLLLFMFGLSQSLTARS